MTTTTKQTPRVPKRATKAKGAAKAAAKAAATESAIEPKAGGTMQALSEGYIKGLEKAGKSHGTLFSYGMELKLAMKALGAETAVAELTADQVAAFFTSDLATKTRTGKPKAKPTIDKTRRVLRLALDWAVAEGWIETAPLPKTAKEAKS